MLLNQYSVRIVGGNETSGGYVELRHSQTYRLQLRNNNYRRCDARVEIDGIHIGTWRLDGNSSALLEHPANDEGKFTFYRAGTNEANTVHPESDASNYGLVKVTFTPEYDPPKPVYTYYPNNYRHTYIRSLDSDVTGTITNSATYTASYAMAATPAYRSAGVTGLSGHSNQVYGQAADIQYDYSGQTTIFLRLVCVDNDSPRPLTQFSTPVPPPVR